MVIATGAEVNVKSDWDATTAGDAEVLNKPVIEVVEDWNPTSTPYR